MFICPFCKSILQTSGTIVVPCTCPESTQKELEDKYTRRQWVRQKELESRKKPKRRR